MADEVAFEPCSDNVRQGAGFGASTGDDPLRSNEDRAVPVLNGRCRRRKAEAGLDDAAPGDTVEELDLAASTGTKFRGGPVIEAVGGIAFDNAPGVHHRNPVGDGQGIPAVVGYKDRGDAFAAEEVDDLVAERGAESGIEVRERLVEKEDAGTRRQGP